MYFLHLVPTFPHDIIHYTSYDFTVFSLLLQGLCKLLYTVVSRQQTIVSGCRNVTWHHSPLLPSSPPPLQVKESPVPSDSLLTLDLKSGSKINIGTHAITLDKFFDSNLKSTKWLDIGNGEWLAMTGRNAFLWDTGDIIVGSEIQNFSYM